MYNIHCKIIGSIFLALTVASQASAAKVEYSSMNTQLAFPEMSVGGQGIVYDKVTSTEKLVFNAQANGRCGYANTPETALYYLKDNTQALKHNSDFLAGKYFFHNVDNKLNSKKRTWSSNMTPISVSWKANESLKADAIKACNVKRQSLVQSNTLPKNGFKVALNNKIWSHFLFSCRQLVGVGYKSKNTVKMHPVLVNCETLAIEPMKAKKSLVINNVAFKPIVPSYAGMCPKNFSFSGSIKSNGAGGKIRYRFKNNVGAITAWISKTLPEGVSSYPLSYAITLKNIQVNKNPGLQKNIQNQQGNILVKPQLGIKENPFVILEVENIVTKKIWTKKASYKYNCSKLNVKLGGLKNTLQAPGTKKPDLIVLGKTFQIGSKKTTGSTSFSLVISSDEANRKVAGLCEYRMRYSIKNNGNAAALPAFISKTTIGNKVLHIGNTVQLSKGQQKTLSGNIKLKPGYQMVLIKTDTGKKVTESKELNNAARIAVTVRGDCNNTNTPPRPGSNIPAPPRPSGSMTNSPRPTR